MAKVQILTEIEIQKLLSQLKTSQLESFLREISALLARRKTKDKKALEARLLQQLNEECVLSEEHWQEFTALKAKREAIKISDAELTRLGQLIREEEKLRLKRIQILGELSQLRGTSLPQLTQELGIHPPE
jgi:6-phosphogluconate dehydrogenase